MFLEMPPFNEYLKTKTRESVRRRRRQPANQVLNRHKQYNSPSSLSLLYFLDLQLRYRNCARCVLCLILLVLCPLAHAFEIAVHPAGTLLYLGPQRMGRLGQTPGSIP